MFFLMEIEGRLQIVLRLAGKPEENVPKAPCPFKQFGIFGRDVTEYDHRRDEHLQFIAGVSLLFGQFSLFCTGRPVCMALLHIVIIGICNSLMLSLFLCLLIKILRFYDIWVFLCSSLTAYLRFGPALPKILQPQQCAMGYPRFRQRGSGRALKVNAVTAANQKSLTPIQQEVMRSAGFIH